MIITVNFGMTVLLTAQTNTSQTQEQKPISVVFVGDGTHCGRYKITQVECDE